MVEEVELNPLLVEPESERFVVKVTQWVIVWHCSIRVCTTSWLIWDRLRILQQTVWVGVRRRRVRYRRNGRGRDWTVAQRTGDGRRWAAVWTMRSSTGHLGAANRCDRRGRW